MVSPCKRILFAGLLLVALFALSACQSSPPVTPPAGQQQPAAPAQPAPTKAAAAQPAPAQPAPAKAAPAPAQPRPAGESVLVCTNTQDPTTFDPAVAADTQSDTYKLGIYESLIRWKPNSLDLEPALAESWSATPDGLTYTFKLRKGVKFHDGTTFDAEAAKFSFDRMKTIHKNRAFVLDPVESVTVVDPYTLQIKLSKYSPSFYQGIPQVMIVSPTAFRPHMNVENAQKWAFDNAVGTGPYKLSLWTPKARVELVKYDDYWGGWNHPHVERIVTLITSEPATRRLLLEKGDVQVVPKMEDQADDIKAVVKNPKILADRFSTLSSSYITLNTVRGPTADKRVRQAMAYAMDYQAILDIAYGGVPEQARGPLNQRIQFADPNVFQYTRNLDKARALMKEAGHEKGFDFNFAYVGGSDVQQRTAEIFQASMADIGIKVKPQPMTWPTLLAAFQDPKTTPDSYNYNNHAPLPDPDQVFSQIYATSAQGKAGNNGGYYTNPEADKLIEQGRMEIDQAKRAEIYKRLQAIVVEDSPTLFIAQMVSIIAHWDHVKNLEYVPAWARTLGYLNRIYIDKG